MFGCGVGRVCASSTVDTSNEKTTNFDMGARGGVHNIKTVRTFQEKAVPVEHRSLVYDRVRHYWLSNEEILYRKVIVSESEGDIH